MERQEQELEKLNRGLKETLESAPQDEYLKKKNHEHHYGHRKKKKKKKASKFSPYRMLVILLCVLIAVFVTLAVIFSVLRLKGKNSLKEVSKEEQEMTAPDEAVLEDNGKYVIWKGERYSYNENILTLLCMGIDTSLQKTGKDNIGENGQADALFLTVIDTKTGKVSLVSISRDTMVDVNRYNTKGQYLGTEKMQICLSYAYGDGREKSCENTLESVSGLMYGIPINGYVALDYQGISVLNDTIGGVPVQILEDLTEFDPSLEAGRNILLKGQQAHTYVRSRDVELLDSNEARMARQKQYLTSFIHTALEGTKSDLGLPLTLYQRASEYMHTDITPSEVTYLASMALHYDFSESDMYSIEGQTVQGEQYAEFLPDETSLYELILEVFYKKI